VTPDRRQLLIGGTAATLLPAAAWARGWEAPQVAHLLPAASDQRLLLKCSLFAPLTATPVLIVGGRRVRGQRTDSAGLHWRFDADGLQPGTRYQLRIEDAVGTALTPSWPLRTLPSPRTRPTSVRILCFTCAGGYPFPDVPGQPEAFRPLAVRHALLERALAFSPDLAVANGDHIYWDQRTMAESASAARRAAFAAIEARFGRLDPSIPALGSANEAVLKRLTGPQIAGVYGTRFRSTPMFFVSDDHDYFENDEASDRLVSFPPAPAHLGWARAVQHLYYPEFLPDASRPALPGSDASDRAPGLSEAFGTLRYGKLVEALIYDCGRFLSLGEGAGLVPPEVERWLLGRTRSSDADHLIHMPSHPFGWTAGKWREWYPDVAGGGGAYAGGGAGPKPYWQSGWGAQHDRLLTAMAAQGGRAAVSVSGDLHAVGAARVMRARGGAPVHSILAGPIGTSALGWPSSARGTPPLPAASLRLDGPAPVERNGFTLLDVTRDRILVRQFAWREPMPVAAIATLQPFATFAIPRPS
jgi:hypothetical protein